MGLYRDRLRVLANWTSQGLVELATRLKSPSVIGELIAGVVLGPSLLGWLEPVQAIKLLAEIGIILLLFEVGLETDLARLARSGVQSMLRALGGFVFPFLLGYGVAAYLFDLPLLVSLFIGGTLTATSIGITVRVLADPGRQHSRQGKIVLGAAVLDEVLGVVLLALLYEYSTRGNINFASAGKLMLFIAAFFVLAPIAAKLMPLIMQHFEISSEIPGMIPTMIVALVLFFAWLAYVLGAPELLGGFAAGLALSRRSFLPFGAAMHANPDFAHRVEEQMKPVIHLFTPIFFLTVGLSMNLRAIDWGSSFIWAFSGSLLVAAVTGKMAGALLLRESWPSCAALGLAMTPRGEVGLIFAELGPSTGIFDATVYAGMVIVIAFTTLAPPFALKWFYSRYGTRIGE